MNINSKISHQSLLLYIWNANTVKYWYNFEKIEIFTSETGPLWIGSRTERITLDGFADYQQNPDEKC